MINRAAMILKLNPPAVDWIDEADPFNKSRITLANANEDRTIYLVADGVADDKVNVLNWLKLNWEALFQSELEAWYVDSSLWPKKLSYKIF